VCSTAGGDLPTFFVSSNQFRHNKHLAELASVPLQDVKKFKLGDPRTFHYLNQSNCYEVANVDDAREYLETRNAMDIVGISQDEQVFSLCIGTY
jgi:hypothetical protein